jgi:hypothetical protein
MLLVGLGCSLLPTPAPLFSRDDAVRKATGDASASAPELLPVEVRIDSVTAELTTFGETVRRRAIQSPNGYGPGRDQDTPVWWVSVKGYFRFQSIAIPGRDQGTTSLFEANERNFIYDARTGDALGSPIPQSRPASATPGPTAPSAKLYDPYRQASPVAGTAAAPTRQSYALTPGAQTLGATIRIAGMTIVLPPDTYVSAYEPYEKCVVGQPCPDPPIYELRRGASSLRIEAQSGAVLEERTAPGETAAFEFLHGALR